MNIQSIGGMLKQAINSVEDKFDKALEANKPSGPLKGSDTPRCTDEKHLKLEGQIELEDNKREHLAALDELNKLNEQLEVLKNTNQQHSRLELLKEIAELESKNSQLSLRNEELLFSLEESSKPFLAQIAAVKHQKDLLLERLEKENLEISKDIAAKNSRIKELEGRLATSQSEIEKHSLQSRNFSSDIRKLQEKLNTVKAELEDAQSKKSVSGEISERPKTKDTGTQSDPTDLQTRYERALTLVGAKTEEIKELRADIHDMREAYRSQLNDLLTEIENLKLSNNKGVP